MGGTADIAEAGTGRAANLRTRADLPKHAFGTCAICTRRLLSSLEHAASASGLPRPDDSLPGRSAVQGRPLVQTGAGSGGARG